MLFTVCREKIFWQSYETIEQMDNTALRKVEYLSEIYYFHCWGVVGDMSIAIIENKKGEVFEVRPSDVRFIDTIGDNIELMANENESKSEG